MWKFLRLLKKRAVLAVILLLSSLYCLSSFLNEGGSDATQLPVTSIKWHDERNATELSCRNSVQGRVLVADDRGYVCHRAEVGSGGCCKQDLTNTKRYSCDTCGQNGCCSIYEYCISCCMHPDKRALLQKMVNQASETFKMMFASVTDRFELCLTKCRTSSRVCRPPRWTTQRGSFSGVFPERAARERVPGPQGQTLLRLGSAVCYEGGFETVTALRGTDGCAH